MKITLPMNKLWLLLLLLPKLVLANQLADTVAKVKPSVVGVGIFTPTGRPQNTLHGTGFVIANGQYVVTNEHVIPKILDQALLQQMVVFVGSGQNGEVRKAEVVAKSANFDIAILKIDGRALTPMTLASDNYQREGEDIAFTGFPIGAVLGLYPVTHKGMISAVTPAVIPVDDAQSLSIAVLKRLRDPFMVYQLDATAYPGNSGSPVYQIDSGRVVAIINQVYVKETKEAVIEKPSGITYAIPVKHIRELALSIGLTNI